MTPTTGRETADAIRAMWHQDEHYQCLYPELHMRVWATPQGMRAVVALWLPGPKYGRKVRILREATWTPSEVTEALVVDWGRRALADWLLKETEKAIQEDAE